MDKVNTIKDLIEPFAKIGTNRSESDLYAIMDYISHVPYLKQLAPETSSTGFMLEICKALTIEIYQPGERIINFGEIGDKFYIILYGEAKTIIPDINSSRDLSPTHLKTILIRKSIIDEEEIRKKLLLEKDNVSKVKDFERPGIMIHKQNTIKFDTDYLKRIGNITDMKVVSKLGPGDSFGELALISEKPRAATIEAKEITVLAVLSKQDFMRVMSTEAEKKLQEKVAFLQKLPIFSGATKQSLQKLSYYFQPLNFTKNQIVYRDGMQADMIYFVESGEFQVYKCKEHQVKKIIDAPSGFFSGQKSLIKIDNARDIKQSYQLQVAIKGKNEMIGYDEYASNLEARNHSCRCITTKGVLYSISTAVFYI